MPRLLLGVAGWLAIASIIAQPALAPASLQPAGAVAGVVDPSPAAAGGSRAPVDPAPSRSPRSGGRTPPSAEPTTDPGPGGPNKGGPRPVADLRGYQWPLPNGRLTLPFGPTPWGSRIVDGERFHDGIDLATFCGDRVVAAHEGVVLAAGRRYDAYMGWRGDLTPYFRRLDAKQLWITLPIVVVIDDGNGYRSVYAHFASVVVKRGQHVAAGELLGYEGRTGRASGCHLHYGLFSPDESATFALDPAAVKRMKLPAAEIARVDPRDVLPPRTKPTPSPAPTANPN